MWGSTEAQLVERLTFGQKVMGLIPAPGARSLLVGLVSVKCDRLRQVMVSSLCLCVAAHKIVTYQSWEPSVR